MKSFLIKLYEKLKEWSEEPAIEYTHHNRWENEKLIHSKTTLRVWGKTIIK